MNFELIFYSCTVYYEGLLSFGEYSLKYDKALFSTLFYK